MKLGSILDDRQYRNSTIDPFSLFPFYCINRWREEKEYLEKKVTCLAFFSFSPRRFRVRELPRLTSLVTCHENLSLCQEIIVVYRVLYSYPLPQPTLFSSLHALLVSKTFWRRDLLDRRRGAPGFHPVWKRKETPFRILSTSPPSL